MARDDQQSLARREVDALIVGAGFAGLYAIHRLRRQGLQVLGLEKGSDVGGTWYWNRYPGARCDIESLDYSYSFSRELEEDWDWSERYAAQPEILCYLQEVARRFDLRRHILFDTVLTAAQWSEDAARWIVETDQGKAIAARFLIMATGCLSVPKTPDIPDLERFAGRIYNTGAWPQEGVDFTGLEVAVIGTGSSAIQCVPEIAKQAAGLTVFQRTPAYSAPANNRPLSPAELAAARRDYPRRREEARWSVGGMPLKPGTTLARDAPADEREAAFRDAWDNTPFMLTNAYADLMTDPVSNGYAAEFVRARIQEKVKEPAVAARLLPVGYPIGTKRLCLDTHYFETYNLAHVRLVDVTRTPIEGFTTDGLCVDGGRLRLDAIVLATGFDAMSGALLAPEIRGRRDISLRTKWAAGPTTYLGLMTAGFPNLFMITGPGSPSVLSNMVTSIEHHVEWVSDCIAELGRRGARVIEARQEAEEQWVAHVNEVAAATLFPQANSWYLGANVPGKPRVFMAYAGGVGAYRQLCAIAAADDYRGFVIDRAPVAEWGDRLSDMPANAETASPTGERRCTT